MSDIRLHVGRRRPLCCRKRPSGNVAPTMTRRLSGILAAGALAVLAGPTARAELDALGTAFVTGGATSNPLLAPDALSPSWDEFTTVRAGLRGRDVGPRTEQVLS